jgi:hypothetical protein
MAESVKKQSRTSRRSSGLITSDPKAVAWAWEKGVKVGRARKPDYHIYSADDVKLFDPKDWIIVLASGPWVSGAPGAAGGKN